MPPSEPSSQTHMEMGGYTTWNCMGCPTNGRHPKAPPPQVHADQTGHNIQVTESRIYVVFPAGQPPVSVETKPKPDVITPVPFSAPCAIPAYPSPATMAAHRTRTTQ